MEGQRGKVVAMLTPVLEKLLILQDRDNRRLSFEAQLKDVPREIAAVEARISSEKTAIDTAKQELRELESHKKVLETEIGSAEEKLAKYRTQQLSVRKNDEYQALGKEIETMQGTIGGLEEKELELMYAIDEAKKKFAAAEALLKQNITGHQARIATLQEREKSLAAELQVILGEVAAARTPVDERFLRVYDRVATRSIPTIVAVRGNKCGGCHLKVSGEVEAAIRGKWDDKLVTCDQCGRVVYWES